ncbi:MAG: hypothetical protein BWK73_28770 [Thiothrix lacustris]|uniref:TIR domain-containing protein n=1 Tax=Thiothrix lacustris TaxID=525917 RepID=A0A1Y1QJJ7_9GAMM|nr:MAG: hypothetical protein BWK73_28770 [Thiothrix lacustris]
MHDIFLSYSTKDRDRLQPLFQALAQQGWSVFWDHYSISTGDNWHQKIDQAICESGCVVVVWSENSIYSEWVLEEASKAKNRDVLLPIKIDSVELPLGFGMRQTGNFTCWNGSSDHPVFIELAEKIYERLNDEQQRPQEQKFGCGFWVVILIALFWYVSNKPKHVTSTHTPVVVVTPDTQKLKHQLTPKDDLWIDRLMK